MALGGTALTMTANMIEQMEKLEIKTRALNEVLETYRRNLATIAEMGQKAEGPRTTERGDVVDPGALLKGQKLAKSENVAIVSGLAETWERLALVWGRMKRSGGDSVYPARAQEILADIQAVEKALAEISAIDNGAGAERALSRVRDFLARTAPAAPSAPFLDDLGRPRTDDSIRPRFLGPTSGLGGSLRARQLAGLGDGAFTDAAADSLFRLGGKAGDATRRFLELNQQVARFKAQGRPLATGLAETNALFGSQADRLRSLGGLLPELGHQLIEVFDGGAEGAARLDGAVAAVGERFLDAFEGAITRGESLGDVLKSLARDLAELALQQAKAGGVFDMGPISSGGLLGGLFGKLGGLFGGASAAAAPAAVQAFAVPTIAVAKGNAFLRGRALTLFGRGGVLSNAIVDRPTLFPMADGAGLMGEAGPEAVLPLTRLANGELGVKTPAPAAVAAGPVITYNIDARGANREGLSRLAAVVREQGATINYINRTLERRAVEAMVYTRGRGGNIARAFGGW